MLGFSPVPMDIALDEPPCPAHAEDWRLARRARAQHPTAWMELVRAHQGLVMALLLRHVRDQDREDLFQETFLRVHRYLGSYRGDAALGTWIYRIAFNVIRTHWERAGRIQAREVLATDWSAPRGDEPEERAFDVPVAPEQDAGIETAEQEGQRSRLRALIGGLKPLDRQVLLLRDVEGHPYETIAERLQVPLGTVKSRLARARAHVAEALATERRAR